MHSPNPVAFSFLGIDIMWYGILIATGFLLAILISYRRAHIFSISKDDIVNFALFMMPVSIIGARLYYVIFSWSLYKNNPVSIFYTRNGGLAIHGGLIAGIIVAAFFCRRRKIRLPDMADLIFPSVALAQSIGRWGNFFNSEAYGTQTSLPWAITVKDAKVHPTCCTAAKFSQSEKAFSPILISWLLRPRPEAAGSRKSKCDPERSRCRKAAPTRECRG